MRKKWVTELRGLFFFSFSVVVCGAVHWDLQGIVESLIVPLYQRLRGLPG